jgi:glycerol-3-phosphate acyltransferase PlsY
LQYFVCLALGYLIGSFPTAYLLVKRQSKVDIRTSGSGNVGAMNAYEVTGSQSTGWIVFCLDFLKGMVTVLLCSSITDNIWVATCGGCGAVVGHIFNPWLGFKGGRGLATTAGILLLLGWMYIIIWCVLYLVLNAYLKQVNLSSVIVSIASPIIMLVLPDILVSSLYYPDAARKTIVIICALLSVIIIIGHHGPIRDFFIKRKE